MSAQPIGVFDSGVGGLTVIQALERHLPHESCVYYADSAHFPYGDKSVAELQDLCLGITDFFLQKHCKAIVIACNSAASAAAQLIEEYVGKRSLVINVIDPVVEHLQACHATSRVGLIGTRQTVYSHVYQKKLEALGIEMDFRALATPLLASYIEFGREKTPEMTHLLSEYLSHPALADIDTLVLACTHYPLIKNQILNFFKERGRSGLALVDASDLVALKVKMHLENDHLLNQENKRSTEFYVSGPSAQLQAIGQRLLKTPLQIRDWVIVEDSYS